MPLDRQFDLLVLVCDYIVYNIPTFVYKISINVLVIFKAIICEFYELDIKIWKIIHVHVQKYMIHAGVYNTCTVHVQVYMVHVHVNVG